MSLEYSTLRRCASQLESALRPDIDAIARYLLSEGFISDEFYEEVLTTNSNVDKASKLVLHILGRVEVESSHYYKLLNHLRLDRNKYGDIVDVLDTEYFGTRNLQASTLPQGQTGKNFKTLLAATRVAS